MVSCYEKRHKSLTCNAPLHGECPHQISSKLVQQFSGKRPAKFWRKNKKKNNKKNNNNIGETERSSIKTIRFTLSLVTAVKACLLKAYSFL